MAAHRSYLFVPGNRPERFDRALASGAHAVIIDLEDAVPPAQKDSARAAVAAWLQSTHPVVLRINAAETPWFRDDLALCQRAGVAAVMLSKAERVADLQAVGGAVPVLPLIESAAGFAALQAIASAPKVQRLAFGALDFQLDLGMQAHFDELLFFRSQLVLASRLANLAAPIDSPCTSFDAPDAVESEALHARRLGFGAKLCIHPAQVQTVNRCFAPTQSDVAWARRVMAAAQAGDGAAVALDGSMVDKPVVLRAQAILRQA